jgi:hypothetical protein
MPSLRRAPRPRRLHPLAHHAAFRAVVAALPALTQLEVSLRVAGHRRALVAGLGEVSRALADGYAAPRSSAARHGAHRQAWIAVCAIDRAIAAAARRQLAAPAVLAAAQRVIDRADVLIAGLPGVLVN